MMALEYQNHSFTSPKPISRSNISNKVQNSYIYGSDSKLKIQLNHPQKLPRATQTPTQDQKTQKIEKEFAYTKS